MPYGLAAAVWSRDVNVAYEAARGIEAGRVWVNSYHLYPARTAFGGYKQSGFGCENHHLALHHHQQVKAVICSYSRSALGFF
jgi:aldehyde dehydrogenase